jgi:hypothetical protein
VNALTLVAQGRAKVFFPAVAGTVYWIAIDSPSTDVIRLQTYPVGGADDVEDAEAIPPALPRQVTGNNIFATAAPSDEDWHPTYHPEASVWWKWTADFQGAVQIDGRRCDFQPRLTILEVLPGGSLTRVAVGFETVVFPVSPGKEYRIGFDTSEFGPGRVEFWIESVPASPPPNDHLADATDLGSAMIACDGGWIFKATPEAGAPNEYLGLPQIQIPGDRTLWWKWTCPVSGYFRFSRHGSMASPRVMVYAGAPTEENLAGSSDQAEGVRLLASAGTTYWIQINDLTWRSSRVELNIHPAATEPEYFRELAERGFFRLLGPERHPGADADGDGIANEIELACAASPEAAVADPNHPRLSHDGTGWTLRWFEDESYTEPTTGAPLVLRGATSTTLLGTWDRPTVFQGESSSARFIRLPAGSRGFGRLELVNPNWTP